MKKHRIRKDLNITIASGKILYRIKRISNGELGGYIEREDNLSQAGECWVRNNALVFGNARIYDNSKITGDISQRTWCNQNCYGIGDWL